MLQTPPPLWTGPKDTTAPTSWGTNANWNTTGMSRHSKLDSQLETFHFYFGVHFADNFQLEPNVYSLRFVQLRSKRYIKGKIPTKNNLPPNQAYYYKLPQSKSFYGNLHVIKIAIFILFLKNCEVW